MRHYRRRQPAVPGQPAVRNQWHFDQHHLDNLRIAERRRGC
ncbi:hypothetical protein [Litorivicinus lipolyticus]